MVCRAEVIGRSAPSGRLKQLWAAATEILAWERETEARTNAAGERPRRAEFALRAGRGGELKRWRAEGRTDSGGMYPRV